MARIRDSRKRSGEVLDGAANKRSKDNHPDTRRHIQPESHLSDVDISADHLSPTFWSTVSAFVQSGATVEAQTIRWRHIVWNIFEIGQAQKDQNCDVDGQIAQSTLNLLHSASIAPPYRKKEKSPKPTTNTANEKHAEKDDQNGQDEQEDRLYFDLDGDSTETSRKGVRLNALGNSPQVPSVQAKKSTRQRAEALLSHKGAPTWHNTWSLAIRPHNGTTWAAGLTGVVTRTFTHEGVNNLVQFLEDLYRTKDVIAINNESRAVDDLRKENDQAREVALRYKALWSVRESAALSQYSELFAYHELGIALCRLEAELDQIDQVPTDQLGNFARKYLASRRQGSRLRDSDITRANFVPQHLLEILGYGKESGHSDAEVNQKKRLLKSQRMTAKNTKAFVDCFGEGCLLLMCKTPWLSALDQASDKTVKPLLEKLAANEPELREIAQLTGAIVKYAKDKSQIADLPKILIRAQELELKQRSEFTIKEPLSPPKSEEQDELTSDETSDDDCDLYCNPQ